MKCTPVAVIVAAGLTIGAGTLAAESFQLPPEVTPALRAACEADVRRMCVDDSPTIEEVNSCVQRRYAELSSRCKVAIAAAGLGSSVSASKKTPTRATASDMSAPEQAAAAKPESAVANFYDR